MKKNNPSIYDRTALGHYPVRDGEEVTLTGFNLGGTAITGSSQTSLKVTPSSWTKKDNAYHLTLAVNSITAINNVNGNNAHGSYKPTPKKSATENYTETEFAALTDAEKTAAMDNIDSKDTYQSYFYNRVPNGDNNNRLTDDIVFDVWQFNNRAAVTNKSGYITEPIMKVNQSNGNLAFAFANGTNAFSMANGTSNSYDYWMRNYAEFSNIALAVDASGNTHAIAIGLDTEPTDGYAGRMSYLSSKWEKAVNDASRGNFDYTHNYRLESVGLPAGIRLGTDGSRLDESSIDTKRFDSTSLAVARGGTGSYPTLYLAYYDRMNNQIRFRYGTTTDAVDNTNKGPVKVSGNNDGRGTRTGNSLPYSYFGTFSDNFGYANPVGNNNGTRYYTGFVNGIYYWGNATGDGDYGSHGIFETSKAAYALIAGKSYQQNTDTATVESNTGYDAGPAVSIDVIAGTNEAGDKVPVVWFDGENNVLMYTARKATTKNNNDVGTDDWLTPFAVFKDSNGNAIEGIGEQCVIKADGAGGIHVVAYDGIESSLYYAYMSDWDGTSFTTCLIDSYNITGSQLSLDVVKEGSNWVPYISYYYSSMKKNKMAYLKDFSSGKAPNGTDPDTETVTGKWEMTIIPSASSVSDDNTNIGFYKNADGTAKTLATANVKFTTNNESSKTSGTVTGNGTTNPVLAYAIEKIPNGYIEIAQKK